jgi:aquaporin Z
MSTPLSSSAARADEPLAGADAARRPGLAAKLSAEAFGTMFLVIAGLGVPLFTIPQSSSLPAPLATGLAVTAAMLAFAYVSGGHFNPAITVGHIVAGRIRLGEAGAYIGAQLVGALAGALALFGVLRTVPGIEDSRTAFDTVTAGFGEHSVVQAPMAGVLLLEVLGAGLLVAVFLGTTAGRNLNRAAAPFAVGLSLAVLLQLGQAIGNAPFNPARATASAVFSSNWALGQLWLFWVAPLVGALVAGLVFRLAASASSDAPAVGPGQEGTATQDAGPDSDVDDAEAAGIEPAGVESGVREETPRAAAGTTAGTAREQQRDEARDFFDGNRGQ